MFSKCYLIHLLDPTVCYEEEAMHHLLYVGQLQHLLDEPWPRGRVHPALQAWLGTRSAPYPQVCFAHLSASLLLNAPFLPARD